MSDSSLPWEMEMSDQSFDLMRRILDAPSPIGLEAAMTRGVLEPEWKSFMPPQWKIHSFIGNAGLVLDTMPKASSDVLTVMLIGHADKIRMQVRSIGEDGKIWINSDSMLPATLIGHRVKLFCEDSSKDSGWRIIQGGTVEALGAIHFANPDLRTGAKGIKSEMLYLELQIHGEDKKKQIEALGIKAGDPIIFDRPIERGFSPNTYMGAYLDNGLGCYVVTEVARMLAKNPTDKVRYLAAAATHEEIGRFGSRVLAEHFRPDVTIAVDVAHDYVAAPGIGDKRFEPTTMGKGFSLTHGAVTSAKLNTLITNVCDEEKIPVQHEVAGRDTGTDAMAAVLAAIDSAAASIGIPIRNMHTISESGHTGDIVAATHGMYHMIQEMNRQGLSADCFRSGHPRLDQATALEHQPVEKEEES